MVLDRPKETALPAATKAAERITVRRIAGELFHKITHLDFRVFRTIGHLCTRPGEVVRTYVRGERGRYSNPFAFAFAAVTLYIALNNVLTRGVGRFFDPLLSYRAFWPYAMFALMIPAVALQRALFRKSGFNFAETYTFALLVLGQLVLLNTLLRPAVELLPYMGWWYYGPSLLLQGVYFAWAVTGFVRSKGASVWLRGWAAFVGYAGTALGVMYFLVSQMARVFAP